VQVSEIFPLEVRAMAIAVFYSIGTALGGLLGPVIFGILVLLLLFLRLLLRLHFSAIVCKLRHPQVESEKPKNILIGYCIASATMIFAGIMGWLLGVDAEGKSLESIAAPLSSKREDGS
jgi:MFS family permease